MERKPAVSIIMPAYNAEKYIEKAICSVQRQTMADWELIVVDDNSKDATAQIIHRLSAADDRIVPAFNHTNRGAASCRNSAMDMHRGEYIAFLDADDMWHPEKLDCQLAEAAKTKADIVCCSYALVDEEDQHCHGDFIVKEQIDLDAMLRRNEIGCSTVLLSPAVSGYRFRERFFHEDYALWLEMLQDGHLAVGIQSVLVDYRIVKNSRSNDKRRSALNRWRIYRNFLHLPIYRCIALMCEYGINGLKKYA